MQGNPQNMQKNPTYSNVVAEVQEYLEKKVDILERIGVCRSRLAVDPGFGFGKTFEHNIQLFKSLDSFRFLGIPLLVGLSRKSFLGDIVGREVKERLQASVTAAVLAVKRGVNIVPCIFIEWRMNFEKNTTILAFFLFFSSLNLILN